MEQDGDPAPGAQGSEEAHGKQDGVGEQQSIPRTSKQDLAHLVGSSIE